MKLKNKEKPRMWRDNLPIVKNHSKTQKWNLPWKEYKWFVVGGLLIYPLVCAVLLYPVIYNRTFLQIIQKDLLTSLSKFI